MHSVTPLASTIPAAPVLGLMALGVLVALAGHIVASRRVVALGLALLFAATLLMIVLGYAAYEGGEDDPRPGSSPTTGNF